MPRKKKDDLSYSSRHIRRLAQQLTEQDLQDTPSCSYSSISTSKPSASTKNVTSAYNMQQLENSKTSENTLDSVTFDECNFSEYGDESNVEDGLMKCEKDDEKDSMNVDCTEELNDTDDSDSIDCDDYRYSDSDADSISSEDIDVDFDIDEVFENLNPSKDEQFRMDLTAWARDFEINHSALKVLLCILNKYTTTTFCKDPRTMLKTPKYTHRIEMDSGQYCHLGVASFIEKLIKSRLAGNHKINTVNLLVNIDGAPIVGKSSEKGLWLILCKEFDSKGVHVIGIYCGTKKPENHNTFLQMFVNELTELINSGFIYQEQTYNVRLYGLICDAPAKAFILCTKYHSGYYSCSKCVIKGEYFSSVCFPLANISQLKMYCKNYVRTDEKCKNLEYINDYQRGETIMSELPYFGLVSNVPVDSMHLVYLGIMKQIIRHWVGDKNKNKSYKLTDEQIEMISDRLENLRNILPTEFNRRSRSLNYWKQWKATEFRHFLLYFGPFVLKNVIKKDIYNNFLKLHISILILSNSILVSELANVQYAESMIIEFIHDFQKMYGPQNVTYDIHNLLHLPKDVQKYGSLDMFDAFPFDNYICSLKKMIRKGDKPLQQIAKRLTEYESIRDLKYKYEINNKFYVEKLHYGGIVPDNSNYDSLYKVLKYDTCILHINDDKNNCVMLKNGTIVNLLNIGQKHQDIFIIGKILEKTKDLYELPNIVSDVFGIKIVKERDNIKQWPCSMISCKVFKIPITTGFIVCPIIHTFQIFNK